MKNAHIVVFLAVILAGSNGRSQTNTNNLHIVPGYNLIANPLDHGSNTLNEVLQGVPTNTTLYTFDPVARVYTVSTYHGFGGWSLNQTLAPGTGAILHTPPAIPFTNLTFTGTVHVPVLPLSLTCGLDYLVSSQTNAVGSFESITGISPQDGTEVFLYNTPLQLDPTMLQTPNYTIYTSCGGAWVPSPPVIGVGQSVFLLEPCFTNPCITVTQAPTNIIVTATNFVRVNYSPTVIDACGVSNFVNIVCSPPSGTLFGPGTTPVHCVAVDSAGNAASCDFTVTIAPPPIPIHSSSYGLAIHPGLNLIANQLDHGGNTLREVIPVALDGTVVSKYNNASSSWAQSTYNAALGAWVPATVTLAPGEGAFLQSPTNTNLIFTGQPHVPVLPVNIVPGTFYLLSRQTVGPGNYTNIVGASPTDGIVLYKWDPVGQTYIGYSFFGGSWSPQPDPSNLVGESVWIAMTDVPPPPIPSAPSITQQPSNQNVSQSSSAAFTVAASGTPPLNIIWRLNGNNLIGETNATLNIPSVQPTNCGSYDAVVYNSVGAVNSTVVSLTMIGLTALPFADNFGSAGSLGVDTGVGTGSNIFATLEPGEPSPANIPGGASVWVQWTPSSSGVASVSTAGSGFDTLLGVYTGDSVTNLTAVAADDDSGGFLCGALQFNAQAGTNYAIQVDGFYGVTGNIILSWGLATTTNLLPVIAMPPQSVTAALGSNVTLSVTVTPGPPVTYQWFRNDASIAGETNSSLVINSVNTNLDGLYRVEITNPFGPFTISSLPVTVQINANGTGTTINADARFEDKFRAATDYTRTGTNDPYDPSIVTGYSGTQIFTTYAATTDPGENNHCGQPPCGSYWGSFTAVDNGRMTVDDIGTTYDAILAAYTGPNTNFGNLIPVACSAGHTPFGNEIMSFDVLAGSNYWIVISGVTQPDGSCTSGSPVVNNTLITAPSFVILPTSQTLPAGVQMMLSFTPAGTPSLGYQWQFNGTNIPGATGTSYMVTNFQAVNQGGYSVVATNAGGTNLFLAAQVYLNNQLQFINTFKQSNVLYTQLVGMENTNYIIQVSPDFTNWTPLITNSSPIGIINFSDPISSASKTNRYYRGKRF